MEEANTHKLHEAALVTQVTSCCVCCHLACRYVRQEHALWQELHAGTLTTSKLPGALGMREPTAARAIRGPQVGEGIGQMSVEAV